jgi:hypothetical protein
VQYILNLLAHGATVDGIIKEYKGLTKEDILACSFYASETLRKPCVLLLRKGGINQVDEMNIKRVVIATVVGLVCGLFCAHGTMMMAERG